MVDAEDVLLVESAEQDPVEFLRRGTVVTERFFNDDASAFGAVRLGQLFDNQAEQPRWDGEVMRRPLRGAELLANRLKGCRVVIVTVDVTQQARKLVQRRGIGTTSMFVETFARSRAELVDVPTGLGHADDRHIEMAAFDHRLE